METLSAHSRTDVGIPAGGIGKHFDMPPSSPTSTSPTAATNPASRMLPPRNALDDDKQPSQTSTISLNSQGSSLNTHSSILTTATENTCLSSPPSNSQHSNQKADASQIGNRVYTQEEKQQQQQQHRQQQQSQETEITPARHKRTASGLLKTVETPGDARPRADSVSSNGSKVGEAAAQLKTRLAYAMAKVQHGWEHRNINEVEQLAAALPSRVAASPPASSAPIDLVSPRVKQRRSGSGLVSWSLPESVNGLASAVEMATSQSNMDTHRPAASSPPVQAPSTPSSRPAPLRSTKQTQQAEQDAINGLMLMGGSPSRGTKVQSLSQPSSSSQQVQQPYSQRSRSSQNSSGQTSPSRSHAVPGAVLGSPQRPATASRNHSSTSDVSVAASEVREARERLLDDVEEAA